MDYQEAIDDSVDVSLEKENVRVEFEYIGEGLSGDYNKNDLKDIPLFRFYISKKVNNEWEEIEDASYCTRIPINVSKEKLEKMAQIIMDRVYCEIQNYRSIRNICEGLSWIDDNWKY